MHQPDADGRCVTWDLTPGSYDRALPGRLAALRDVQASKDGRAAERAHLDTGPPDVWQLEPPDELISQWVDEWIEEREDRERLDAMFEAEFNDAIATILDGDQANTA